MIISHPFVFCMILGDAVINKIPPYFHKPYISDKTLPVYLTIHFCHCKDLNDKNT